MLRLLLIGLLVYLGYTMVRRMFQPPADSPEVHGRPKTDSLDMSSSDIEDARFEEIDEDDT